MREASELYTGERRSVSGLVGGQGKLMREYAGANPIGGEFTAQVIAEALSMGESNACMRRIVAAPTAGACGVLPAVLIPLYWRDNLSEDQMLEALFTASGIGAVIAYRACISGAAGGCQAEIGSASAMAAGALVYLRRGAGEQMCPAVAMALGGIDSRIPVDEVIDAMGEVGRRLPVEFRETALGGLAATPTGKAVKKQLHGDKKKQRTLTIKDSRWKLERSEEAEEPAVKDSPKGKKGS